MADDVNFYVSLNPALVNTYRLIGYDNRVEALRDTSSTEEGGEIGSGHSLIALFELSTKDTLMDNQSIANVEIHYRQPGSSIENKINYDCSAKISSPDSIDLIFNKAAIIAMLGMKLKESSYTNNVTWKDLESDAKKYFRGDSFFEKDFINIIGKARKIYSRKKIEK